MSDVPPFEPDHESPTYVYVQLADHITERIKAGDLKPGQRLRPEREQAEEYGVAYLTVRRAMRELRSRGLILTVVGKGTFVNPKVAEVEDLSELARGEDDERPADR
ncbi:winged helix-turn-helix domain-containing protein [Thermomonospora catenispora]|uniref:winged helix-turn-helix domain-containing protein n=1 Tax=Thermomonospora catenispora TaxID=2493090 RepID=UPI00111E952C|nr:winged helix-turn-helix domain-containing protein [Thermomonospora catenispora]TNY35422.1 GntR family transcriptional regulator [Thermomonospora catenispora]